jgi:hypothetical protein
MKPLYTFDENLGKQLDLVDSIISFIYQIVMIFLYTTPYLLILSEISISYTPIFQTFPKELFKFGIYI